MNNEKLQELRDQKPAVLSLLAQSVPSPLIPENQADIQEALDERSAIQEYDAGLTRKDAETEARAAFALALTEDRQIRSGIRPERFSILAYCTGCGVVWLPSTWFMVGRHEPLDIPKAHGCRWCGNRLAERPRPRPYPLAPSSYDPAERGPWPYDETCRPLTWQGGA